MEQRVKVGDTVTLIDKPWEWDGWAKLPRKRRLIYKGFMGKENEVIRIIDSPNVTDLLGRVCADIGRHYIVPLAILRKVEPVDLPFDFETEPVKAEPKRVPMTNEPHPEIKEGARFVVVNKPDNIALKIGDVLVLCRNDNSRAPFFYHNDKMRCEWWKSLAPLEARHRYTDEQINEAKMIIGRLVADLEQATGLAFFEDGNLTRLYIDGRKVSEAKCSPQDEPNRAIGRMVAMLKRFDEPLPTWIRE